MITEAFCICGCLFVEIMFLKSFLNPLQEAFSGFQIAAYSVGDPEPDPHVVWPDPDPLVRGTDPAPDPSLFPRRC
jgi:hypothetical protein